MQIKIRNLAELAKRFDPTSGLDKNKIILVALIALFLAYLDISIVIKAQTRGIGALRPKIAKLRADIDDLAKAMEAVNKFAKDKGLAAGKGESDSVKKIIREEELPLFLQEISDTANGAGAKIIQIKPVKDAKAKEEMVAGARLMPLAISLDISCGYHALSGFISAIENSKRLIFLQEIRIMSNPDNCLSHNIALSIKTYVKK